MVNKLFSSYLLVITGNVDLPTLHLSFEAGTERTAKDYAANISRKIASNSFNHFALFIQTDDQQTLVAEWNIKFEAVLTEIDLTREITT